MQFSAAPRVSSATTSERVSPMVAREPACRKSRRVILSQTATRCSPSRRSIGAEPKEVPAKTRAPPALLANTIGYIDPTPAHEWYMGGSIRSLTPSLEPTAGVAFTCELDSSTPVGERGADEYAEKGPDFYDQLDAIAGSGLPAVWVVR